MSEGERLNDPMLNTVVAGRYEVYAKLGEGGMGAVYAARQAPLGRTVALKVLLKQLTEDPIAVKRFEKEALAISRLAHPNTVTIFDFGTTEQGLMYIAMEFLEGRSLRQAIEVEAPMEPRRAVRILAQIARALSEAHNRGVIHRDLKPDNIMLVPTAGEPDFVKVLDFGVAKLRAPQGVDVKTLTQGDVIFGTPRYMSPEQVNGVMNDSRSDLYAVGAIAYEMLGGCALFDGDSAMKILMAHLQQKPRPFAQLPRPVTVPGALEKLVMRLLVKAPEDRYQTADALLQALDELPLIGGGLRPQSGKTEGLQLPVVTPGSTPVEGGTQAMGSNFAAAQAAAVQSAPPLDSAPTAAFDSGGIDSALMPPEPVIADSQPKLPRSSPAAAESSTTEVEVPAGGALRWVRWLLAFAIVVFAIAAGVAIWVIAQPPLPTASADAALPPERLVSLTLRTEPPGAVVIVDDSQADAKSPVTVPVMAGKEHEVRIQLAGYRVWQQKIPVETDKEWPLIVLTPLAGDAAAPDVAGRPDRRRQVARRDAGGPSIPTPPAVPPPPIVEAKPDASRGADRAPRSDKKPLKDVTFPRLPDTKDLHFMRDR
ncbi:MAG: serine/threonine protein kinase [Deltaproteobacteria bacterium]|nr:serine/threonine protein kinase [Deltaproteobacteria bacterium]